MVFKKWDDLPDCMKNDSVILYYEVLKKKQFSLLAKRLFDLVIASITSVILMPIFIILSLAVKLDSNGPVMYRQTRVTQYGKKFMIFKFRTMVHNTDEIGALVTTKNDIRVTKVGKILRKFKLDEIPQLLNIIMGDMSFVGTLLLPAGVTSEASITYKNEELLLSDADDTDEKYIHAILPEKMKYNLRSLKEYNFFCDIKTMVRTVVAVFKRDEDKNEISDTASMAEINNAK